MTDTSSGPSSVPVLAFGGEIDLAVAPELRRQLEARLDAGSPSVVLDLRQATFLDSVTLGVLIGVHQRCTQLGGHLTLVVTDPRILRVLEITGLDGTLHVTGELPAADHAEGTG